MEIRFIRIDDRLVHGQVTTVWAKAFSINRILVVSDSVARDTFRKTLLQQAAPPNIFVNVVTIDKMIEVYSDYRFVDEKVMLLLTNPEDVVRLYDAGVYIHSINIGSMSFSFGKKMVTNSVAVDESDVKAFEFLSSKGIHLEVRKVVADSPINLGEVLNQKWRKEKVNKERM